MRVRERIVADTNCLVSRLLLPSSVPGDAVRKAVDSGLLLVSEATMNERPTFWAVASSTTTSLSPIASSSCGCLDA
jgi:hypothetical protein